MAQRRIETGLPGSIAGSLLSRALLQAEEQRTRPAASRDHACDFRERAVLFAAEQHAGFEHGHLVLDAAPFAQQDGAGLELTYGGDLSWPACNNVIRNSFELTARGGAKPAKRSLPDAIGDCACHQITGRTTRRFGPVE